MIDPDDIILVETEGVDACRGYAVSLLLAIAEGSGAGSDHVAYGCAELIRSILPDAIVSPNDLLDLAAAAIDAAVATGSAAAGSLRLQLTTSSPDLYLVANELRAASDAIR